MSKFVDSLLMNRRTRRQQRLELLDDHLRADIGLTRDEARHAQPFLLGALLGRSG